MGFLGLFVGSCAVRISTGLWTKMMYFWRSPHVNENFGAKMCSRPGFCSKFIIHMRRTRKELMFLVLKKEGNRDIELDAPDVTGSSECVVGVVTWCVC